MNEMKNSYDVVVIGSGFGGSITGCRLAQAGRSVCILEKGKKWDKTDFPRSIGGVAKAFWKEPKNNYGFLEYLTFKNIDVIQGRGVGGGSLHYFNVNLRTPEAVFDKVRWPKRITRKVMDPYYDVEQDMLNAERLVPPEGRELPARTEAFLAAAQAAGGKDPELIPIAVYTKPDGENEHSGLPQTTCNYQGNCLLGCDLHAKNTLDLNYLPVAEKNGAEIHPLHQADRIEPIGDNGYKVYFKRFDPDQPGRSEPGTVTAKTVIVSAGTLSSNELLLRCRDVHKSLPNLSHMLGKHFSGNGDFLLAGTIDADREIDPSRGPSITAGAGFPTKENLIYIEDLGFPNPLLWFLDGMIPNPHRIWDTLIALKTYVLSTIGIRTTSSRIGFEVDRLFEGAFSTNFLPYLGMGTDAANGVFKLDKNNNLDLDWKTRKSRKMFNEMEQAMKKLSRGVNGKYLTSLLWAWPIRKLLTAHPLGGCSMGDSKESGVVNEHGEVWGYKNLYVADGSIMPTALSVNPVGTISALSERIAFWMIHGREMEKGDPKTPANK